MKKRLNITKNKAKNRISFGHLAVNLAIFGAFLVQTVNPAVARADTDVLAKDSQNQQILTQTHESRMFFPNIVEKADKTMGAIVTAYTSTPGQTDDDPFTAAWGERVYDGMIANNCLPHNTIVKIPSIFGDKVFRVSDRLNKRYGCNHFDVWMDTTVKEARKFGVKKVVVEIHYPEAPILLAVK